nr:hypothetical protein [uncultured Lachnoclostridium sp.]
MNSTTTLVAKQCRLETWAQQIQDYNQRPQGMSVKDWCSQQGVNFYSCKSRNRGTSCRCSMIIYTKSFMNTMSFRLMKRQCV